MPVAAPLKYPEIQSNYYLLVRRKRSSVANLIRISPNIGMNAIDVDYETEDARNSLDFWYAFFFCTHPGGRPRSSSISELAPDPEICGGHSESPNT